LQIRRPALIYSHETALYLHDLTDRDPVNYSVTVPTGYNTKVLSQEGLYVHSIQRDLYSTGITEVVDMFNHKINVYNVERTICDILRDRSQIDISIITDALKRYVKRRDKNLNLLMEYAELFKVTKVLRNYLEVLL
jgi:predicted transcriptional regulator of viral defense system